MSGSIFNVTAVGRIRPTALPSVRPLRVLADQKYWQEQGWRFSGDQMRGYYRTYRGSFEGVIRLFESGDHLYYVVNPPRQLMQHPHWPCFSHQGSGVYWVHFNIKPKNVDSGIIVIETILREALERYL